ncbi:MAG TPA: TGS domain-containing protein [Nitrospiraceae bacterium]|nr:TGS domain-containing protein [Nitrospiraceae bacterium]
MPLVGGVPLLFLALDDVVQVMKITLKDGNSLDFPAGQTVGSALSALGLTIGPDILAAKVNGQTVDLSYVLTEDAEVTPLQFDRAEAVRSTDTAVLILWRRPSKRSSQPHN